MTIYTLGRSLVVHCQDAYVPWVADYACTWRDDMHKTTKTPVYNWFLAVGLTSRVSFGVICGWTIRLMLGPLQLTYHRRYTLDGKRYHCKEDYE